MADWHAQNEQDVYKILHTGAHGLDAGEAGQRLQQYGANSLPVAEKRAWYRRLFDHINNLLIYVLIASAVVAVLLDHVVDACIILAVVMVNTVIGYIQEGRAEKALESIQNMLAPHAIVLRDGRKHEIEAQNIVPGDIVLLAAGDRVPADIRLTQAKAMRIDEAALTGESVPVEKMPEIMPVDTPLAAQCCMAFSGTFVTAGQGFGVAVGTGTNTQLGHINAMLHGVETLKTPLLRQMDWLAQRLTVLVLAVAILLFFVAYGVHAYEFETALMIVVGFAVALIPEGLPAVMTITLAIGVHRMSKRNAIIRKLPAVETVGAVTVICSDKTGTLTRNEMIVRHVLVADAAYTVSGEGYSPQGAFTAHDAVQAGLPAAVRELARASVLCNDSRIAEGENGWTVTGDPMEGALVALGGKAGYVHDEALGRWPRLDEIPFDAQHRFMATLHAEGRSRFLFVKGAPEQVIAMCSHQAAEHGTCVLDAGLWHNGIETLSQQGERVLAIAVRHMPENISSVRPEDVQGGFTLLGLTGLIDPPREEVIRAVRDCRTAAIRVVMITGDHIGTAQAIASQIGLADGPKAMTGQGVEALSDEQLREAVKEVSVFARANPEHKLRLVRALQAGGEVAAMTGDGVNDAPALKQADVGIAMGHKGTEVAKEAAEVVLADDNFASIAAAVREGRTVYDNLRKVIAWTLPTNVGQVMAIVIAVLLGTTLPLTPALILWINMVTSVALGLVLAFEPTEPNTMVRPPRDPKEKIVSPFMLWRIAFVSVLFACATFAIFAYAQNRNMPLEVGHTLVVNVIVVLEIFYLFSVRYVHGTSLTLRGVVGTPLVLLGIVVATLAQFALTYVPFMNRIFGTMPVSVADGFLVVCIGILFMLIVELEKLISRKWNLGA